MEAKMKNLVRNFSIILVCAFFIIAWSPNQDILIVKTGTFNFDKSQTVGQAFGNYIYFTNIFWEAFRSENNDRIVQLTGDIDLELYPKGKKWKENGIKKAEVIYQFLITNKGKSFEAYTFGIKFYKNDGTSTFLDANKLELTEEALVYNLKEIYKNVPFS
jgi:hypothetical protein